jgi:hypothetical protein
MEKHTAIPEIMNKSGIRQILIRPITNHRISNVCLFCGKKSFIPKGIKLIVEWYIINKPRTRTLSQSIS